MAFTAYYNREFDVNVTTQEEQDVCQLAHECEADEINDQLLRMETLARKQPQTATHPFFQFTLKVMEMRKANMIQAGQWKLREPLGELADLLKQLVHHNVAEQMRKDEKRQKIRETIRQVYHCDEPPPPYYDGPPPGYEQPLVGPMPGPSSFLGFLFEDLMTDRIAHANMDPNKLPSTSYIEEKAKATVLWDITMGRR